MTVLKIYPAITRAAMAHDSGGVVTRTVQMQRADRLQAFFRDHPLPQSLHPMELAAIDRWLSLLSTPDLHITLGRKEGEIAAMLKHAPPHTDQLLEAIFENVC